MEITVSSLHPTRDEILRIAEDITTYEFKREAFGFSDPNITARYLVSKLSLKLAECFFVVFLDNRHNVIAAEELFQGTIDGASVHSREVVRRCLHHNAGAVILAHNHPSGVAEPSAADRAITTRLREALGLIDVRLLDHFVVGGTQTTSLAQRGWI